MKRLIVLAFLAWPLAAHAQTAPRSIDDCERIKSDLAYNQCLAQFGPKAHENARGTTVGENPESTVPAGVGDGSSRGRRSRSVRGSRGRKAASFDVVSPGDGAEQAAPTSRRRGRSHYRHRRR